MAKTAPFITKDGRETTADLVARPNAWYAQHLSRDSQLANVIDELVSPNEVIRGDLTVIEFIDILLAYINQTILYNQNTTKEYGLPIRDAIVVPSGLIDKSKKSSLKYTNNIDLSGAVISGDVIVEIVSGYLPPGLELKKHPSNQYTIEGYVNKAGIATDLSSIDVKAQRAIKHETIEQYLNRQLQFRSVEYVDGPNSNTVVTNPIKTLEVGNLIRQLSNNESAEIKKLVTLPELIITVDEFRDDGLGAFDYVDGSLLYDENGLPYEDLSWYGYLSSGDIYLRYKRVLHSLPDSTIETTKRLYEFTLGFREEGKTEYHDLKTFQIKVRGNSDQFRDNTLSRDYGKLLSKVDFKDVPKEKTEIYWTPDPFGRTIPFFLKYKKSDTTDHLIPITGDELNFDSLEETEDDKLPTTDVLQFTKNVDRSQEIRSDILLSLG